MRAKGMRGVCVGRVGVKSGRCIAGGVSWKLDDATFWKLEGAWKLELKLPLSDMYDGSSEWLPPSSGSSSAASSEPPSPVLAYNSNVSGPSASINTPLAATIEGAVTVDERIGPRMGDW